MDQIPCVAAAGKRDSKSAPTAPASAPPTAAGPLPPPPGSSGGSMMGTRGFQMPELSPGRAMTSNMTVDETLAEIKKSPLFMDELDMDNEAVVALQALAYDGTPLENATNFKEQGNECFREKRWADAKEFYGKGVAVLAAEEAKRKRKAMGLPPLPPPKEKQEEKEKPHPELGEKDDVSGEPEFKMVQPEKKVEEEVEVEEDPAEVAKQLALLEQVYVNRAACQLELRNYRACTVDCAFALRLNPRNVKALYRSAKALLAVSRIEEADDACARGLAIDGNNPALKQLAQEIVKKQAEVAEKTARESARERKQAHEKRLLQTALEARNIRLRSTGKPPDMEDAKVELVPDPSDPESTLAFPTLLLYPLHYESDFIKAFNETESLEQHFGYVFPLPWDHEGVYSSNGVECYMETVSGGLVKVGKKVPLLKVLGGGNVEVVDELIKIFVVPRGRAEGWVKDWKEKKGKK